MTRKWVADLEAKGLPAKKTVAIMNEECEKSNVHLVACPPELKKDLRSKKPVAGLASVRKG